MDLVTTPDACVEFVEEVGLCTWRHQAKFAWLPSLETVTDWHGTDLTMKTWFWKDDLHIERRLYFGMLIAPAIPVFVSLEWLPVLIAAQGDIDARTLYERGLLASNALRVYTHVEQQGPTATQAMPWPAGSRMLYLATLQQRFLLTKFDLTGRTRRTYGQRWCLCEEAFPQSFERAGRIAVVEARGRILEHLRGFSEDLTGVQVARMFRWLPR